MADAVDADRLLQVLPVHLRGLASRGALRRFRRHTVLLQEGEPGDTTWFLLQGRVRVFAQEPGGREITHAVVAAGDYFAEMWLDGGPRSASVMTIDPCVCAVVPAGAVREHLAAHPEFALELVARVIRRARAATRAARDLALLDVYGRLAALLQQSAEAATAGQPPLTLAPVTHQELAHRVGASREMVSRLLKDLERGGYVALGSRRITVLRRLPARW